MQTETTYEQIIANPTKYGLPTFEDFAKNPDKWREAKDELFRSADGSIIAARQGLRKQTYEFEGYRANSLEEVERMCEQEGVAINSLEMRPHVIPVSAGVFDLLVHFRRKPSGIIV